MKSRVLLMPRVGFTSLESRRDPWVLKTYMVLPYYLLVRAITVY